MTTFASRRLRWLCRISDGFHFRGISCAAGLAEGQSLVMRVSSNRKSSTRYSRTTIALASERKRLLSVSPFSPVEVVVTPRRIGCLRGSGRCRPGFSDWGVLAKSSFTKIEAERLGWDQFLPSGRSRAYLGGLELFPVPCLKSNTAQKGIGPLGEPPPRPNRQPPKPEAHSCGSVNPTPLYRDSKPNLSSISYVIHCTDLDNSDSLACSRPKVLGGKESPIGADTSPVLSDAGSGCGTC